MEYLWFNLTINIIYTTINLHWQSIRSFFSRSFSIVSPLRIYHVVKNHNGYGNIGKEIDGYLNSLYEGMLRTVSGSCSKEELQTLVHVLRSEYSRYKNSVMWKTGIMGNRYIDIYLSEKIFRISFSKLNNGDYVTYVKFIKKRDTIPAFFRYCNYCRKGLAPNTIMTCSKCSTGYCCKNCQAMDWICYHSYNCPSTSHI